MYVEKGISVIPVGSDKRPLIPWKAFQTSRPHPVQIDGWFRSWGHAGVAIICGQVSGISVMDVEYDHVADIEKDWLEESPPTAVSKRGGLHLYFAYSDGCRTRSWNENGQHFGDLKSEGGYVVAPPSTGYRWMEPLRFPLPPMPRSLMDRIDVCGGAHPSLALEIPLTMDPPPGSQGQLLTPFLMDQLLDGESSRSYVSRSERIFFVIRSMAELGWCNDAIVQKILLSPLGEKYRARGGDARLMKEVQKLRRLEKTPPVNREDVVCIGVARYMGGRLELRLRRDDGSVVNQGVSQREGKRWPSVLDAFGGDIRTGVRLVVELWEKMVPGTNRPVLRVKRFFPQDE
jgi:hypothetical protein